MLWSLALPYTLLIVFLLAILLDSLPFVRVRWRRKGRTTPEHYADAWLVRHQLQMRQAAADGLCDLDAPDGQTGRDPLDTPTEPVPIVSVVDSVNDATPSLQHLQKEVEAGGRSEFFSLGVDRFGVWRPSSTKIDDALMVLYCLMDMHDDDYLALATLYWRSTRDTLPPLPLPYDDDAAHDFDDFDDLDGREEGGGSYARPS